MQDSCPILPSNNLIAIIAANNNQSIFFIVRIAAITSEVRLNHLNIVPALQLCYRLLCNNRHCVKKGIALKIKIYYLIYLNLDR